MSRYQPAPRRLVDGGDGSGEHTEIGALLARVGSAEPQPFDRQRVWAKLSERPLQRRPRLRLALALATSAALAVVVVVVQPWASAPPAASIDVFARVAMVAGDVRVGSAPARVGELLSDGDVVKTRSRSRAFVRFEPGAGVLLEAGTDAALHAADNGQRVTLNRGQLTTVTPGTVRTYMEIRTQRYVFLAAGTVFTVRSETDEVSLKVSEGVVEVSGTAPVRVVSGWCWSSTTEAVRPCEAGRTMALVKLLARPVEQASTLHVESEDPMTVAIDGYEFGPTPIQWWSPLGRQTLSGQMQNEQYSAEVDVIATGTHFRFARKTARRRHSGPPFSQTRRHSRPRGRGMRRRAAVQTTAEPTIDDDRVSKLRERLASATSDDERQQLYYELGVILTGLGKHRGAIAAFEEVVEIGGAHAELAVYELGRVTQRYLGDNDAAIRWLRTYQRRFPDGALRQEIELSLIESSVARPEQALQLIDAFLVTYQRSERRHEVRLLRANILRGKSDFGGALSEYERVLGGKPRPALADDATYFAALCEAKLGRLEASKRRLEAYLERFVAGKHRDAAERTLESSDTIK